MKLHLLLLVLFATLPAFVCNAGDNGRKSHNQKEIIERVEYIFHKVYENDDHYLGDSKFLTTQFKKLHNKEKEVTPKGEIGYIDYDHWTQSQDWKNPSITVLSVEILSDSEAIAKIKIQDYEWIKPSVIKIVLIYERGNWFIDDFIGIGGSEKKGLLYILNSKFNNNESRSFGN